MINKEPFIRLNNQPLVKEFDINTEGKDYFVGDIHGTFKRLKEALNAIGFDGKKDRLFCCGDLVDRGGSHRDMLDIIGQDWFHACLGNHDDMLLTVFENSDLMTPEEEKEPHDIIELPVRQLNKETGKYENVGVKKMTYEEYYQAAVAHGDRVFLKDFSIPEMKVLRKYMESLPLMMRIKTHNGDIGMVHAEIPLGRTFQETIDWISGKDWSEAPVAREYLFWGERARYLPYDADMLFMTIFNCCSQQEQVDNIVNKTAQDLYLLYMGHNIMPVKLKSFHKGDVERRLEFDTKHLKFIDHGSFVADQIETDAYGLGIYDNKGEMILWLDTDPI
jgi:hypothetical protein